MKVEMQRELGRRTLALLDNKTTDMAAHTLEEPLAGYRSVEQWEREKQVIFGRYPMFAGLSCDLPQPGSWLTFDATGTPILLTRDSTGRVRAFLNMCRHRGVRVVEAGSGAKARRFTCPFHAWSYDIEGKLVGVTGEAGFTDLDKGSRGLIALPAEERYGMIFVAAQPEAAFTIDEYLGGLAEQFEEFGFDSWHSIAPAHPHPVKANWKVAWGTHLETYHFAYLHKYTAGPLVYGNTSIADFYGDHALMTSTMRTIDELRDRPEQQWRPVDDGHINLNYRLFPNLSLSVVSGDRLEIYTIYPGDGLHETVAMHYAYRRTAPAADEVEELEKQIRWACQTVVDNEDYAMAAHVGAALRAPYTPETLVFGRNEPVMQHMALCLRRVLDQPQGQPV